MYCIVSHVIEPFYNVFCYAKKIMEYSLKRTTYNEADKMGDIHMYMYINKQINNKMQRHCLNNEDWAALQHNESSDWKASAILLIVFVSKVESSE